jgi:hypothetical protein
LGQHACILRNCSSRLDPTGEHTWSHFKDACKTHTHSHGIKIMAATFPWEPPIAIRNCKATSPHYGRRTREATDVARRISFPALPQSENSQPCCHSKISSKTTFQTYVASGGGHLHKALHAPCSMLHASSRRRKLFIPS